MNVSLEPARGCGFRKVGGLYLMADGPAHSCGKMPIPLCVCPTCGGGIKPARGWTWIDGDAIAADAKKKRCSGKKAGLCVGCPMDGKFDFGRAGLIWIGEQFYPTPGDFQREAKTMGISRRIAAVPRGFELGTTFVFLAHRFAVPNPLVPEGPFTPGVFSVFLPKRIEVICSGNESEIQIAEFEKRGLTPVKVIPIGVDAPLFDDGAEGE